MIELLLKPLLQLVGNAIPIAIRWHYKPERLSKLVHVRLDSEGDGVELWAGNIPYYQFWLVIRNASPFELTLTGVAGRLSLGPGAGDFTHFKRLQIKSGKEERVYVRSNLNLFEMQYLHAQRPEVLEMDLGLQFACSVNDFERLDRLKTSHLRHVNFESALSTWLPGLRRVTAESTE